MPPKRRKPAEPAPTLDRLPPHSQEAEQGVLGSLLLSPGKFAEVERAIGSQDLFYDLRHALIWKAIQHCGRNGGIDTISVQQWLSDRQRLDEVGGLAYLCSLPETVPSAENLPSWLEILREKYLLRRTIERCIQVVSRAYEFEGEIDDFLWATKSDLAEIVDDQAKTVEQVWGIKQLNSFDFERDPNAIIGLRDGKTTRYLCRGYPAWLIGPSGIGKSSLIHQMAFCFALGQPVFGIAPVKPLNILIVQAENDEGDAAEMTQGVLRSFGIDELTPEQLDALDARVHVVTERRTVGEKFCEWLGRQIVKFRADVVFVDPFLSFAGVDVNRQDQCTLFLRQQLNPILADTGAVLIAAHHTGKPKPQKDLKSWTAYDYAYAGIGSSELVNWARAVMVLLPLGDGTHFELKLTKRGSRAAARSLDGEFTTSIFLKHALDRIYWDQVAAPEQALDDHEKQEHHQKKQVGRWDEMAFMNLGSFLAGCKPEGEGQREIARRLASWLQANGKAVNEESVRKSLLGKLVEKNHKLRMENDLYFKGPNA